MPTNPPITNDREAVEIDVHDIIDIARVCPVPGVTVIDDERAKFLRAAPGFSPAVVDAFSKLTLHEQKMYAGVAGWAAVFYLSRAVDNNGILYQLEIIANMVLMSPFFYPLTEDGGEPKDIVYRDGDSLLHNLAAAVRELGEVE